MPRGNLPKEKLVLIDSLLQAVVPLQERTLRLSPDLISLNFPKDSDVPVAAVCFQDSAAVLCEVRLALHEYHAHRMWYREYKTPPDLGVSVMTEKFFLDDAALRIYAAGEHLAEAIRCMFGVSKDALKKYQNRYRCTSEQCAIGKFMEAENPNSSVTQALVTLIGSDDWKKMRDYRDRWVHKQPPTVVGMGIVYNRIRRWKEQPKRGGYVLYLSAGDQPELTIEKLAEFISGAFHALLKVTRACFDEYENLVKKVSHSTKGETPCS
jgi:hypothetical protein